MRHALRDHASPEGTQSSLTYMQGAKYKTHPVCKSVHNPRRDATHVIQTVHSGSLTRNASDVKKSQNFPLVNQSRDKSGNMKQSVVVVVVVADGNRRVSAATAPWQREALHSHRGSTLLRGGSTFGSRGMSTVSEATNLSVTLT